MNPVQSPGRALNQSLGPLRGRHEPVSDSPRYVLGINYRPVGRHEIGHHPSAVLLKNGQIVAMAEEERFIRVKEAPGRFPTHAIRFCLQRAGIDASALAAVGWNWNPDKAFQRSCRERGIVASFFAGLLRSFVRGPFGAIAPALSGSFFPERQTSRVCDELRYWFGLLPNLPIYAFDHHLAHAASAFFPSGFTNATVVTLDCWGDSLSGMICRGSADTLDVLEEFPYSHFSLGKLNDFVFDFLRTTEKGNLMGLAAYGTPCGLLAPLADASSMTMRMDLLDHSSPFPVEFTRLAGQPRRLDEPIEQRHKNLAADLQASIEGFGLKIVDRAIDMTGSNDVCLAGGCALNATLNGKIGRSSRVNRLFVQPQAGDAGGALGAAYLAQLRLGALAPEQLDHVYWGSSFTDDEIAAQLQTAKVPLDILPVAQIPEFVSEQLQAQKIVGWFRLGAEWGPRALGARSILADPRRMETRDLVNRAVKYRDWWRPFAPSMLANVAGDYLEEPFPSPFMLTTFKVKTNRRSEMDGVTHHDGTCRPQMVVRNINAMYYDTIEAFGQKTGVPMVLNTSMNLKGEPIVNSPRDALRTFFSSGLDVLVMNSIVLRKTP